MIRSLCRRALLGGLTVFAVYTLTFLTVVALPGNPLQQSERRLSHEIEEALRARYNLDDNWEFFWQYLRGALQFDFGPTFTYSDWSCSEILAQALPVSVTLGLLGMCIAVGVGVPVGCLTAVRASGWIDRMAMFGVLLGVSLPSFVSGSLLLWLFSMHWTWAPVGGWGSASRLPLPAIALSLPFMAVIVRLTRSAMLDAWSADFIRTARAKGLTERRIVWNHALRSAMLPVVGYLGPATAQALTGSFVVEKVFGVPGLGQHFVNAALNRDIGLILAAVVVFSALIVVMNIGVDLLYERLDPRIRNAV